MNSDNSLIFSTKDIVVFLELCDFIEKEWVFVYKENGTIKGFYIVQREGCKQYGYSWVNKANKKAIRFNHMWGNEFDGLYDIVYKKETILVENS